LEFIPVFGTLHCRIYEGHKAKKDIPMPIYQVSGNFKELKCYTKKATLNL
jgi:hypothetical protein